jgi:hypothetical protein
MPSKCYSSDENYSEILSFTENKTLNTLINVQFLRFPPLLMVNDMMENNQTVKYQYCGPLIQLIREFAIKENVK